MPLDESIMLAVRRSRWARRAHLLRDLEEIPDARIMEAVERYGISPLMGLPSDQTLGMHHGNALPADRVRRMIVDIILPEFP